MKKSFVLFTFLIAGLFVASTIMISCGSKKTEQATEEQHHKGDSTTQHETMPTDTTQTAYACPMHPDVTGKEGDKCSKCGMALEAVKDQHQH